MRLSCSSNISEKVISQNPLEIYGSFLEYQWKVIVTCACIGTMNSELFLKYKFLQIIKTIDQLHFFKFFSVLCTFHHSLFIDMYKTFLFLLMKIQISTIFNIGQIGLWFQLEVNLCRSYALFDFIENFINTKRQYIACQNKFIVCYDMFFFLRIHYFLSSFFCSCYAETHSIFCKCEHH